MDTGRSTSGFVFLMAGAAVSYRSRRGTMVLGSTAAAEYVALYDIMMEGVWVRSLLVDMGSPKQLAVRINEDNQAAIKIAVNLLVSDRSKSIRIKYHAVREMIAEALFELAHCGTDEMTADIMTKSLGPKKFARHRKGMGVW